jgi:exopolysaccharide biosynthesis polyprenyl glycosylphosphotransferase
MMPNSKTMTFRNEPHSSSNGHELPAPLGNPSDLMQKILPEDLFLGMLCLERKRAERSDKKFLLLLLDAQEAVKTDRHLRVLNGIIRAAQAARRETDLAGWYKDNEVLGIIFTELGTLRDGASIDTLLEKVHDALLAELSAEDLKLVHISAQIFADDSNDKDADISANPAFYPDLSHQNQTKQVPFLLKRVMDVIGSAVAIALFSPLFFLIAALVKLTSKGPVLFKQERLGQFGKTFTFLKFRSMHVNNDRKIHQEFMQQMISGAYDGKTQGGSKPVYKMKNDPRVTRVGRFLRRLSLDELPQFFNVLKGDMSLVGPRPPLAYEYEEYDVWHRRRVLEIKPGITGLWQVNGRSRVGFDDIVRLDLRYARGWSLWLDLKILAQTPRAVLFGDGAY